MLPRLLAAPAALLLAACLAAPAPAAVDSSAVTTPTATFRPLVDKDLAPSSPARQFTFAGTSNLDAVRPACVSRAPDDALVETTFGTDVAVTGGAFSVQLPAAGQAACRLLARPTAGGIPADLTPFSGPRYFGSEQRRSTFGGVGPGAALLSDFYAGSAGSTLSAGIASIAAGGAPHGMIPIEDTGDVPRSAENLWYDSAALYPTSSLAGESRSELQVDGVNAFLPAAVKNLWPGIESVSGLPGVTIEQSRIDPATGDITHVSTEQAVTCPTDGGADVTAAAATPSTCGELRPAGVAVRRTVIVRSAARTVETIDRWSSTDGRAHALDALYDEKQKVVGLEVNGYRFPWVGGAAFNAHATGDTITPPPGRVASLFAKVKAGAPDNDPRWTQGSLTIAPKPDVIRFVSARQFQLGYRRTVPATGALGIEQRFSVGTRRADVETLAATLEQRAAAGLAVTITSPTQVTGYDPAYTVSGTTTAPGGAQSLVVNDIAVTPAADGRWSAKVRLAPGANPITATVADAAGDSAVATGTVTFTPGPAQSALLTGGVTKGVLNATVRCQTVPGATCTGRLALTARVTRVKRTRRGRRKSTKTVTLAARTYAVPDGDSAVPPVRLGRATRTLIRKYRIRRATLTLTQTVRGITKTTKTSVPVRL